MITSRLKSAIGRLFLRSSLVQGNCAFKCSFTSGAKVIPAWTLSLQSVSLLKRKPVVGTQTYLTVFLSIMSGLAWKQQSATDLASAHG